MLSNLFGAYVERSFDSRLAADLDALIAAAEVGEDGAVTLSRPLGDPQFQQLYSGRYWQIDGPHEGAVLRSRSLWDQDLALLPPDTGMLETRELAGPEWQQLRLLERHLTLPGADGVVRLAVAADRAEIDRELRRFRAVLAWSLGALGAGLILAVLIQIRYGLWPLRRMRRGLADIRAGRAARMRGEYPAEIMPLVAELNALLKHNAAVVERARTHVGNLAHALKTPLSVLTNEAAGGRPAADTVRQQTEIMRRHVEHHLARARAAASADVLGARTPVRPVADDLARTLARIHAEKAPEIDVHGDAGFAFRGERQDLEEMLGNLMDNACKWARRRVRLGVAAETGRLRITVEDDGPGLPAAERARALERGRQLDEAVPGSGLGLAIVQDIAALYGGAVALGDSALGGLLVVLDLPAAPAGESAEPGPGG